MSRKEYMRVNKTVNRIFYKFLLKMLLVIVGLPFLLIGGYYLAEFAAGMVIWYPEDLLYRIGKWIELRIDVIVVFALMVGYPAATIFFLRKPFSYLKKVLWATENLFQSEEKLIELPYELKEIESELNSMKLEIGRNARAAKEAEQRKNDLVVYLAHDLKTPLTSVIGYLTLLRDEGQISEDLRQKYLSISLEKAEHLEDLINEFFEITRFNLSNLTLELSRVNLTRMLEQLVYEFKPMLDEKQLDCKLSVPKDLEWKCDIGKMQRVFDNLLRNAVNYSFEKDTIFLSVTEEVAGIKIVCVNHGNTIPKEKLERIFEQFYRLDTARTTRSGGAGLGLAIAKEIVELHHGTISAFSENETIRFEIVLPKAQ